MKKMAFSWIHLEIDNFICKLNTGIEVNIEDKYLIQIDTGCPNTFLYDFYLKNAGYELDYEKLDFDENDLGDKFYYIKEFSLKINENNFIIPKCYIEKQVTIPIENTIREKNLPLIGYIGNDIFENKKVVFDYKSRIIIIFDNFEDLKNLFCVNEMYDFKKIGRGYIILPIFLDKNRYGLFDTAFYNDFQLKSDEYNNLYSDVEYELRLSRPDFNFKTLNKEVLKTIKIGGLEIESIYNINCVNEEFESYLFYMDDFDHYIGNNIFLNKVLIFDFLNNKFSINK
jgi:hypothetical protein